MGEFARKPEDKYSVIKITDSDIGVEDIILFSDSNLILNAGSNIRMNLLSLEYLASIGIYPENIEYSEIPCADVSEELRFSSKGTNKKIYHIRRKSPKHCAGDILDEHRKYLEMNKEESRQFPYATILLEADGYEIKRLRDFLSSENYYINGTNSIIFNRDDLKNSKGRKRVSRFPLLDYNKVLMPEKQIPKKCRGGRTVTAKQP